MDIHTRQAMTVAKKLIDEKKYYEAQVLLGTINHPKAKEWLNKLDKIVTSTKQPVSSLEQKLSFSDILPKSEQSEPTTTDKKDAARKKSSNGCLSILILIILCSIIPALTNTNSSSSDNRPEAEKILKRLFSAQSVDVAVTSNYVSATIAVSQLPAPETSARQQLNTKIADAICQMKDSYKRHQFEFDITYGTVTTGYGTQIPDIVLIITVSSASAKRLNCSLKNNLASIADDYIWSPG